MHIPMCMSFNTGIKKRRLLNSVFGQSMLSIPKVMLSIPIMNNCLYVKKKNYIYIYIIYIKKKKMFYFFTQLSDFNI